MTDRALSEAESRERAASPVPRFTRSLSGFGVIVLTLSVLSPGASVLVSGGSILQQAGTGVVLAFLIGALVCFCQTSMIAELGASYPKDTIMPQSVTLSATGPERQPTSPACRAPLCS